MKKKNYYEIPARSGNIANNPIAVTIIAVIAIIAGIFFTVSHFKDSPIPREDAVSYTGEFDFYDAPIDSLRGINLTDGSVHHVFPYTETEEFYQKMTSLEKGTKLYILVNPNNDNVIEVKTDTEELLNFELAQKEIYDYSKGSIWAGSIFCASGVLLILYVIGSSIYKRTEFIKQAERKTDAVGNSIPLRHADMNVKSRILLEAKIERYHIIYRRVKSTNELVINGRVYDEKKGVIEFAHALCASLDGHFFEAGLNSEDFSYISFDGNTLKSKKRLI